MNVNGSPPDGSDFFITYSGKDEEWATWIASTIESAGHTVVLQVWDFGPGDNFLAEMDRALANCRHTLGLLSPSYFASVFARAEWTAAYKQAITGRRRGFIPVRIARCDVAPLLGPISYIDLVDLDEDTAREHLLLGLDPPARRSGAVRFPGAGRS